MGVDKGIQDKLLRKLQNGQIWDSMNPEKLRKVPTGALTPTLKEPIKRYVFPDGSVIVSEIENLGTPVFVKKSGSGVVGISGGGTGYYQYVNKKISYKGALYGYGFYADFTLVNGAYDYIDDVYDPFVNVVGGSGSINSCMINKSKESSTKPARATCSVQLDFAGGVVGSGTHILELTVGKDTYKSREKR